jgi:hypothetical protein
MRDLDEASYLWLKRFVQIVAEAVYSTLPVVRTHLYRLGSQQGNKRLRWQLAGLLPRAISPGLMEAVWKPGRITRTVPRVG